jgi:hypothetical protein
MVTRDEWLRDGALAGGVGTITGPAQEPDADAGAAEHRAGQPGTTAAPRVPPQRTQPRRTGRRAGSRLPGQAAGTKAPDAAPRRAAPGTGTGLGPRPGAAPPQTHRMPFFLLLCCLLGGALICALVISTTLAAGSFQITRLQQANSALATQRQRLQEEVAAAQSAQVIQLRALQLGMRPVGELRFINLKTGKAETDAGSRAVAAIDVPGYTP